LAKRRVTTIQYTHTIIIATATAKIESVWNVNNNQESQKRKQGIENKHTKS